MNWLVLFVAANMFGFDLVNNSGYLFIGFWLREHQSKKWGEDYLHGKRLESGESVHIYGKGEAALWDLRVMYKGQGGKRYEIFEDLNLPKVQKITVSIIEQGRWDAHYE
jgi:hypothetical protein